MYKVSCKWSNSLRDIIMGTKLNGLYHYGHEIKWACIIMGTKLNGLVSLWVLN